METTEVGTGPSKRKGKVKYRATVHELIRNALAETAGDEAAAVSILVDQALEDVDYVREIFSLAVQAMNRHDRSSKRGSVRRAASMGSSATSTRALGTALARPLLEFPLQDGTSLKDAYAPQIDRAAHQFGQQGSTMMHLSRWLLSVHTRMAEDKPVGESLDELTIRQLFDETASA
jgi:hypothetical protein